MRFNILLALVLVANVSSVQAQEFSCPTNVDKKKTLETLKAIDQFMAENHYLMVHLGAGSLILSSLGYGVYVSILPKAKYEILQDITTRNKVLDEWIKNAKGDRKAVLNAIREAKVGAQINEFLDQQRFRIQEIGNAETDRLGRAESRVRLSGQNTAKAVAATDAARDFYNAKTDKLFMQAMHERLDLSYLEDFLKYLDQEGLTKEAAEIRAAKAKRLDALKFRAEMQRVLIPELHGDVKRITSIGKGFKAAGIGFGAIGGGTLLFALAWPSYIADREKFLADSTDLKKINLSPMERQTGIVYTNETLTQKRLAADPCIAGIAEGISNALPALDGLDYAEIRRLTAKK